MTDWADVLTVACLICAEFGRQLGSASGVQSGDEVPSGWSIRTIVNVHAECIGVVASSWSARGVTWLGQQCYTDSGVQLNVLA